MVRRSFDGEFVVIPTAHRMLIPPQNGFKSTRINSYNTPTGRLWGLSFKGSPVNELHWYGRSPNRVQYMTVSDYTLAGSSGVGTYTFSTNTRSIRWREDGVDTMWAAINGNSIRQYDNNNLTVSTGSVSTNGIFTNGLQYGLGSVSDRGAGRFWIIMSSYGYTRQYHNTSSSVISASTLLPGELHLDTYGPGGVNLSTRDCEILMHPTDPTKYILVADCNYGSTGLMLLEIPQKQTGDMELDFANARFLGIAPILGNVFGLACGFIGDDLHAMTCSITPNTIFEYKIQGVLDL
jgi:hypothetical protein